LVQHFPSDAGGGGKAVADLEIFRGGFSFTKMPAKLEVKTKKTKKRSSPAF